MPHFHLCLTKVGILRRENKYNVFIRCNLVLRDIQISSKDLNPGTKHAFIPHTCSIAVRMGFDDCGSNESNVSTRTSINSGVASPSISSSPDDGRSDIAKAFLEQIISSEAASENSPGRRSTCRSNWMSRYLSACILFASALSP